LKLVSRDKWWLLETKRGCAGSGKNCKNEYHGGAEVREENTRKGVGYVVALPCLVLTTPE